MRKEENMTKEERRQYMREYYHRNKQKILEQQREKYATDKDYREMKIENAHTYAIQNKSKVKETKQKYYEQNKEKIKEYFDDYYTQNQDKINTKRKEKRGKEKIVRQDFSGS